MDIFSNLDLAESKLIILYTINSFNFPITNNQLTNLMIENNFMNYFVLQQYISELLDSGFIENIVQDSKSCYTVTPEGKKILEFFIKRVPLTVKEKIQAVVESNVEKVKQEIQVTAEYFPERKDEFSVHCRVSENNINLIELKVLVPNRTQAKRICENWEKNSSEVFIEMLESLTKNRD